MGGATAAWRDERQVKAKRPPVHNRNKPGCHGRLSVLTSEAIDLQPTYLEEAIFLERLLGTLEIFLG